MHAAALPLLVRAGQGDATRPGLRLRRSHRRALLLLAASALTCAPAARAVEAPRRVAAGDWSSPGLQGPEEDAVAPKQAGRRGPARALVAAAAAAVASSLITPSTHPGAAARSYAVRCVRCVRCAQVLQD